MNTKSADNIDADTSRYLTQRRSARKHALQYLYQVDHQGDWEAPPQKLEDFRAQVGTLDDSDPASPKAVDWGFAGRLIKGVCEHREEIDRQIGECAQNWQIGRMNVVDRNILRVASYELLFGDDIPDIAAINEAIEVAREFGDADSPRFVNGILDRILREKRAGKGRPGEGIA